MDDPTQNALFGTAADATFGPVTPDGTQTSGSGSSGSGWTNTLNSILNAGATAYKASQGPAKPATSSLTPLLIYGGVAVVIILVLVMLLGRRR